MTWKEEELAALRLLESAILRVWSEQHQMNDYTASRAYAAAYQRYPARLRGRDPKPQTLSGLDLVIFNAVLVLVSSASFAMTSRLKLG